MEMNEIEQLEEAARKHSGIIEKQLSFFQGGKFMHQFAQQESEKAVEKRDEQIREWIEKWSKNSTLEGNQTWESIFVLRDLKQFLSTPTVEPTSAEPAQVELTPCDSCTAYPFDERGKTPLCGTCKDNPLMTLKYLSNLKRNSYENRNQQ